MLYILSFILIILFKIFKILNNIQINMGIGDWGLGIGDLGLGPNPKTQNPKPKTQNPKI
jgi:hypothetical protein